METEGKIYGFRSAMLCSGVGVHVCIHVYMMHIWHEIKFIHDTWAILLLNFGCLIDFQKDWFVPQFLAELVRWSIAESMHLMPTKFVLIVFCFCLVLFIFCRNVMKIVRLMSFWVQNRTVGCKLLRMCLYAVAVLKPRKLCYAFMCVYILLYICACLCVLERALFYSTWCIVMWSIASANYHGRVLHLHFFNML